MKKLITPIIIAIVTTVLFSCDKVDTPLVKGEDPTLPPPTEVVRRILMEEYTGHYCTNCP